jgi:nucleoid DNA-binding protein
MTWSQLVKELSGTARFPKKRGGLTQRIPERAVRALLRAAFMRIAEQALHNGKISVPDFGTFYKATRKERRIVDIETALPRTVPAQVSVGFRCSKSIKR